MLRKYIRVIPVFCTIFAVMLALIPVSKFVHAEGPLAVTTTGKVIAWKQLPINLSYDQGTLGKLSNQDAVALYSGLNNVWAGADNTNLSFTTTSLPMDIDETNVMGFLNNLPSGVNPVIFDTDGKIIELLTGAGSSQSILGFAGPLNFDTQTGEITQGRAVLNGLFMDGKPMPDDSTDADFKSTYVHELGHFLGLGHVQILKGDDTTALQPVMFPTSFAGSDEKLRPDDVASIALLYPRESFAPSTGKIRGRIFMPDGVTPFQGANVVAKNIDNPSAIYGIVSGYLASNPSDPTSGSSDPSLKGFYELSGLLPGRYTIEIEPVRPDFKGGSSVGPVDPPISLPGPAEFYNDGESNSDDPGAMTVIEVTAGQTREDINIIINGTPDTQPDFTISFADPNPTVSQGDKGFFVLNINRIGGFTGDVTIEAPDTSADKIKLSPPSTSTSDAMVSFKYKIKRSASTGTKQLIFTATDASGLTRTATLMLEVQ